MSKYIDTDKLIAEIERRIEETKSMKPSFDQFWAGQISAFKGVRTIITTLQQEQPEVDLEKEIDDYIDPIQPWEVQEAPFTSLENCARHFYELGKNSK